MSRRLLILGTSGLATEVALVADRINARADCWSEIALVGPDRDTVPTGLSYAGADADILATDESCDLAIGIGIPSVRARAVQPYLDAGERFAFPNLVHPQASVEWEADRNQLGRGNVLCAGVVFTCDIRIGDFNYFNLNVTVGHACALGDNNVLNPGANVSGGVVFGDRCLVGTGAQVLEYRTLGDDVTVGASALVNRDVPAGVTVVGVPARPLER